MGKAEALRLAVSAGNAVLRVAFAPQCAACGAPLPAPIAGCVCDRCWLSIEPAPHVDWPRGAISLAAAAGDYGGSLRRIMHAFKYDGRRSLAARLGLLMRAHGEAVLHDADCVIPVPLHPWRRVRRGFNQSADLAAALGVPVAPVLRRTRATMAQAGLSAADRQRNVRGAFALSPLLSRRRVELLLRDRNVVVVDDVRTTGATLHACAEILRNAGARDVRALTAAVRAAVDDQARSGATAA